MARQKRSGRQGSAGLSLQDLGLRTAGLGLLFLIIPSFFSGSPAMKAVSSGLSLPAWLFLSAGLIMLAIAYLKKQATPAAFPVQPDKRPNNKATAISNREKQEFLAKIAYRAPVKSNASADIQFGRSDPAPNIQFGRETTNTKSAPPFNQTEWSPAVFAAIEWRRFEAVCEALFAQAGFKTTSQSHGADGGVDIWLHSANAQGPVAVVQCKHWNSKAVGVKEIREFFGVMASHQLKRGTYATTSTYTADAQQFAKNNGINALDGQGLLGLIFKRTPEQQQALLTVAFEGEYWRPTCASCGIKLVECAGTKSGSAFWGCSNYPRCNTRMQMTAMKNQRF